MFPVATEPVTTHSCGSDAYASAFETSLCALSEDNNWPVIPAGGHGYACKCHNRDDCNKGKGFCDCGEGFGGASGLGASAAMILVTTAMTVMVTRIGGSF